MSPATTRRPQPSIQRSTLTSNIFHLHPRRQNLAQQFRWLRDQQRRRLARPGCGFQQLRIARCFMPRPRATSGNRIVQLTDTGDLFGDSRLGFTAITLATAPTNEAFRGVALAPTAGRQHCQHHVPRGHELARHLRHGRDLDGNVTTGATGWVSFRQAAWRSVPRRSSETPPL